MSETVGMDGSRSCESCGEQADPGDAYCGSCGGRVRESPQESQPATVDQVSESIRRHAGTLSSRASGFARKHAGTLSARIPDPARKRVNALSSRLTGNVWGISRRDALMGVVLGVGCAVGLMVAVYAVLLLRGTFGVPAIPRNIGFTVFALLHGGSAAVEVPPIPLLDLSGSVDLDLPMTSFAAVPFAVAFLAGRSVAKRVRVARSFAIMSGISYAVMVIIFAALGTISVGTGGFEIIVRAAALSAAVWGALLVGTGAAVGVATISGSGSAAHLRGAVGRAHSLAPRIGRHLGQAVQGALLATAVGLSPIVLLSALSIVSCEYGALLDQASGCEGRGVFAVFLPTITGSMWLLGHGLPVGFQSGSDLGTLPILGQYIAAVPTKLSLLGSNWPLGDGWRVLVLIPALSILLGGLVSARDMHARDRFFQGAFVCVPYVAIAVLVNALVGITAHVNIAGYELELALRVPLAWMLVLLVVTAVIGGLGGLLAGNAKASALVSRLPLKNLRSSHPTEKRVV